MITWVFDFPDKSRNAENVFISMTEKKILKHRFHVFTFHFFTEKNPEKPAKSAILKPSIKPFFFFVGNSDFLLRFYFSPWSSFFNETGCFTILSITIISRAWRKRVEFPPESQIHPLFRVKKILYSWSFRIFKPRGLNITRIRRQKILIFML